MQPKQPADTSVKRRQRNPLPAKSPDNTVAEVQPVVPSEVEKGELQLQEEAQARVETERKQQANTLRWVVGLWVLILVSLWMAFMASLLISMACGCSKMSDQVMLGVLGSTTASILGVCVWVVRSLFPSAENP